MIQNLDFGDPKYRATSSNCTSKTHANQRCIIISCLCDKLLFEHPETLTNLEISVLSREALNDEMASLCGQDYNCGDLGYLSHEALFGEVVSHA
jgi:hypothetical protein